jgi:hypothetical protein
MREALLFRLRADTSRSKGGEHGESEVGQHNSVGVTSRLH